MSADLKKPCSSYILYCNDNRASVKTRLGDEVSQKEVQKELAKMWKDASDETKEKYKKIYQQNKVEYDKKMEAIKAAESDESDDTNKRQLRKRKAKKTEDSSDDESSKKKTKKTEKKETAPRKPNGYQVYMKENKEKLKTDTLTGKKLTEKVQKMWKELDEDEKKKWNEKAKSAKAASEESDE